MTEVAIIGGGVSGLACARLLRNKCKVVLFEKELRPGGLVRCERNAGSLFHICGGHVFNTKNEEVEKWFWSIFNKDNDFIKAERNSAVCLDDGRFVQYPIENHIYQLDEDIQKKVISDWIANSARNAKCDNFQDFLMTRFGATLFRLYFEPYNSKIWRRDLSSIPLDWLAGKLPMPTVEEMVLANINHVVEKDFVHSSFYYPKFGGSQFLADVLAEGTNIVYGHQVKKIERNPNGKLCVDGMNFDRVVFCGNLKELPAILSANIDLGGFVKDIERLESHGTTSVFCETDAVPYSWFYQPSSRHMSHRFICTGNFSPTNNALGKVTCTVEFSGWIEEADVKRQLGFMPYHPKLITHRYTQCTYPIQHSDTRIMIAALKKRLLEYGMTLVGRFAEWEYFNMDAAIASAMANLDAISA